MRRPVRRGTPTGFATALLVPVVVGGGLLAAPGSALAAPALAPLPATSVEPPGPPPLSTAPPAGARPGPAPGLRQTAVCRPQASTPPGPHAEDPRERLQLGVAHRIATGRHQLVAVIDTGVAHNPRLGDRLGGGGDFLTGGDGLDDCDGHGTAVAGLIAASDPERDRQGLTGMAPDAQLIAIRQASPSFDVSSATSAAHQAGDVRTLADAIVLAVRSGATVVNISEAVCLPAAVAAREGALLQAALHFAAQSDVVVVAAAGNIGVGGCRGGGDAGDQVVLPAWYGEDVLAVGAVGPDDAPASFTVPGPWVDVAAPGTDLRSLAVDGGTTDVAVEGTSFSAPLVSGLVALLRERFPELTARQLVGRVLATARRPAGGHSTALGFGMIDPVAALTAVPQVLTPDPPAPAATAPLPGTGPRPPAPPAQPPVTPVVACLLGACAIAARLLRRHPAARR